MLRSPTAPSRLSVRVCSPPSRRCAALRPRFAGLKAWTAAPRTLVQTASCTTAPQSRPLHVVVDELSRLTQFLAPVDIGGGAPADRQPDRDRRRDGRAPVVDVTSAVVAEDITLDLTEAVPTGRSYQSYLQLVPGVLPDDPESHREPGLQVGPELPGHRRRRGRLARQLLLHRRHQRRRRGKRHVRGQPEHRDHPRAAGADRRDPGLVAVNRNASDQEFSRFATALTGGGPIVENEARFFGSYRRRGHHDTVVALDGVDVIRTVEQAQDQFYGRGTASSTGAPTSGRSPTSSSAASAWTISISATPRAPRRPRSSSSDGTQCTAASSSCGTPTSATRCSTAGPALPRGVAWRGSPRASSSRGASPTTGSTPRTAATTAASSAPSTSSPTGPFLCAVRREQRRSQDTFNLTDRLAFNLGLRTERCAHLATDGTNIFTFDWTLAPRLSVSYDPTGDGRQRLSAFYGKY